jgi:hypothetical protein
LTIHDSILHPLVGFLKWKSRKKREGEDTNVKRAALTDRQDQDAKRPKILANTPEETPS